MNIIEIGKLRIQSQHILGTRLKTPKELVSWMGAIQAQDYPMVKWAVGVRIPDFRDSDVEAALDRGDILRTHLLRPTWHLVAAEDIHWMIELTAPNIRNTLKSRHKGLGLSEDVIRKSNLVIEKTLTKGGHLKRNEISKELENAGFVNRNNLISHLLLISELDGIICSGKSKDGKQTYALLSERVPKINTMTKDEALYELAKRYFSSHGPATLQDFAWWSGLSMTNSKKALVLVQNEFQCVEANSQKYWFSGSDIFDFANESAQLLPAYDELIISYKDRSATIPDSVQSSVISKNGMFSPVIVVGGRVAGTWKRILNNGKVLMKISFFAKSSDNVEEITEKRSAEYGQFLGRDVEVIWVEQ